VAASTVRPTTAAPVTVAANPPAPPAVPAPAPPAPPAAPAPPTIPAAFDGIWSGTATQIGGTVYSWTVSIALTGGGTTGTISSSSLGCAGSLTISSPRPTDTVLHLSQVTTTNPPKDATSLACATAAQITLTLTSPTRMSFSWTDAGEPSNTAAAILTHP
jgi:hypothetical protein